MLLNLACFCRYLYVLDVCCQFASCRATLAICKYYCKKCFRNASTIMQQSIKSHTKSIQNRRKWCQGALRKRPWEQVGSRLLKKAPRLPINLRLLAPLGRFWAPFGTQLGAKGVPKSSIWASRRAQSRKNSLQEEVSEKA